MSGLRNSSLWGKITLLFLMALAGSTTASGKVIYVDADAPGISTGMNWENAYHFLQNAIGDAYITIRPVEIRVAQGLQLPDRQWAIPNGNGDREATFVLLNGVTIKGGYAGFGETDPNERNVNLYETILSGDLDGNDMQVNDPCDLDNEPTRFENSYSVLTGNDSDATAVLDGFTIIGGYANGDSPDYGYPVSSGAGMYNDGGSPTVINCTFRGNWARRSGGGMSNHYGSEPTVTNCTFRDNRALHSSGGMYNHQGGSPTVIKCEFINNSTDWAGGAMENLFSHPTVTNCTFMSNSSAGIGGAMVNTDGDSIITGCSFIANIADSGGGVINWGSGTNPIFIDCIFRGNKAVGGGGMFNNLGSPPTLINCTFIGNTADNNGGGMFNTGNSSLTNCTFTGNRAGSGGGIYSRESTPTLSNCILWDDSPEEIYLDLSIPVITYSNVQDGLSGEGNINTDPCFVDSGYWDLNGTPEDVNDDTWIDGDYHLKSQAGRWDPNGSSWIKDNVTSPCIDAGDSSSDWKAELWPHGECINMGAYGGTAEASMSLSEVGNIANLNAKGSVDYNDMELFIGKWLYEAVLLAEDLNRDGKVNCTDFAIFANNWRILLAKATNPNPNDDAVSVNVTTILSWTAAVGAESHDVYFGTSDPPPFIRNQTATTFDPGTMAYNTKYYWHINEVSGYHTVTGSTWSFTTIMSPPPPPPP